MENKKYLETQARIIKRLDELGEKIEEKKGLLSKSRNDDDIVVTDYKKEIDYKFDYKKEIESMRNGA